MTLRHLSLVDFRCFADAELEPEPEGTTVLQGENGTGKTTFLEAVAYLGTRRSFRGASRELMVRHGAERAVIRAELDREGRRLLVEAELATAGRSRTQLNRQPVRDARELARAAPATMFSPDDLALVQGPPAGRRELLDDTLRIVDPVGARVLVDIERILRQRTALLRRAGGRLHPDVEMTLDVWDDRLGAAGTALTAARAALLAELSPWVARAYADLAGGPGGPDGPAVHLAYRPSWEGDLGAALLEHRPEDVRRGVTSVGPHRDDVAIGLSGRDARTQASQGEQRSVALALRLAVHALVTEREGAAPILLLDDVFSELDPARSRALVAQLPPGQTLLTTASPLPPGIEVARVVEAAALGRRPAGGSP